MQWWGNRNSKEEIEALGQEIRATCGNELEVRVHTRKPRLVIINVPENISTTNIENTILRQIPDLNLQKGNIVAKFIYVTKKYRNAVIEVGADTRKTTTHDKIRMADMQD